MRLLRSLGDEAGRSYVADAVLYVLTRSSRTDFLNLRIEPRLQKTH